MTFLESIKNIDKNKIPSLKSGKASSIEEYWDKEIDKYLFDEDYLIKWFDLLCRYVEEPDAVFLLRAGNHKKNDDPYNLRRGFYTKCKNSNISYVYTDNDFAVYMFKLAYNKIPVPSLEEFKNIMINRQFPVHFNLSHKEERDRCAFIISSKDPGVGKSGHKVSHIIDAGMNYGMSDGVHNMQYMLDRYFNLGSYEDWKICSEGYYVREVDELPKEAISFLKAHFLRFAFPLNYVLTPKTRPHSCQSHKIKIYFNDIGETDELKKCAVTKFYKKYPNLYQRYLDKLMIPSDIDFTFNDIKLDMEYGLNLVKSNKSDSGVDKEETAKVRVKKSKKSYIFDGNTVSTRILFLRVIEKYVKDNSEITFAELKNIFNIICSSNRKPLIRLKNEVNEYEIKGKRVFVDNVITLKDGTEILVNNQLTQKEVIVLSEICKKIGYSFNKE